MKKSIQNNITDRWLCDRFLDSRKLQVSCVHVTGYRMPVVFKVSPTISQRNQVYVNHKTCELPNYFALSSLQFLCKNTKNM